ncbi:hypothetical protein FBUS_05487 [Fasciolopsis buskii]|uniref:Secreted protein n=1 Tax=Fasciolopsis buskii TaxID=27845 RepID=A0A8E0S7V7_9TREM|nr:hypothetical protein FBUS_05487 [Fasciolopsis buski]
MHKSLWLSFMCILSSQLLVLCKADSTSHVILVDGNRYVVKLPSERHFCKAAASCADFGHHVGVASYLIGRHYKSVAQKLRDAGKCAWTSLSQLLVSAALPPLIWLDGDLSESRLFVYAQTQWWISKKNATLYPIAVLFYESKLLDSISITSSDSLDVLCEYRNTGLPPSLFIHKFSQKVPQVLESFMVEKDKTAGCLSSGKSRTMLACVWSCSRRFECRSAYYNWLNADCVQALYVDSLLSLEYNASMDNWIRYAKVPKNYLAD